MSGDDFRKVTLSAGSPRGGLLGMAAVLAMGVPTVRPVGQVLWRPAVLALAGLAAITPMVIVQALVVRFYLVP